MKKLKYFVLLLTLLWVVPAYGLAPSDETTDANYVWEHDTTIDTLPPFDTLTSATDSVALLTDFYPKKGYEYILARDAITGTGSDSVTIAVQIRCESSVGTLLYTVAADSMTSSTAEAILLPFGETAIGHRFDVMLKAYTGMGGQVILNRFVLYRRNTVQFTPRKKFLY